MSLESLKKLSELFNSELQETKLRIMEKREAILEKFNLEKLNLQKELHQIEESIEFFEKENELLTKNLSEKQKDFATTQSLFDYEKKSSQNFQKEKIQILIFSTKKAEDLLIETKNKINEKTKKNIEKNKEIEKKIQTIEEQINIYHKNLGVQIDNLGSGKFSINFEFPGKNEKLFLILEIIQNKTFKISSCSPKNFNCEKELLELNEFRRLDLFVLRIREKFLQNYL